jgi:hypothetical protein
VGVCVGGGERVCVATFVQLVLVNVFFHHPALSL